MWGRVKEWLDLDRDVGLAEAVVAGWVAGWAGANAKAAAKAKAVKVKAVAKWLAKKGEDTEANARVLKYVGKALALTEARVKALTYTAKALAVVSTVVSVVSVVSAAMGVVKRDALLEGSQESNKPAPSMYLSKLALYLLPKHVREEWLGDLEEVRQEMLKAGHWRISVALITYARLGLLLWSLVRIKLSDLVPGKNTPEK